MRLRVEPGEGGGRLDVWLAAHLEGISRSRVQALIRDGCVRAGGRPLTPHTAAAPGLELEVVLPAPVPVALTAEDIPVPILFEDADVIVVDKPAGLVVHPAAGHASGTLVNALLHHCRDLGGIGGEMRPGIVHRLDRDTSGAMVVAKNQAAMDNLARQFKEGRVRKEYVALVHGVPRPAAGCIETLIGRSASDRKKMAVQPERGRSAVTLYEVAESFGDAALLNLRIKTGRTHQIRVHMKHLGCPVVGDPQYGSRRRDRPAPADRQMLHARRLTIRHPADGSERTFEAPLPRDFAQALEYFRRRGTGDGGCR